ncbi:MAG: hypothetical protein Q8P90_05795 [bacterium]|nr:hypothetical protein [bacterium]
MRYLVGVILIVTGVVAIIFTKQLMTWFGRIQWAEDKLGAEGGTQLFYKLLGMGLILLAFMFMSGRLFTIVDWIFVR